MNKSHPFSIYLLKDGFNSGNSLKGDHSLTEITTGRVPAGATLFLGDSPGAPPWWKSYFDIAQPLTQTMKAAILILPVDRRVFAVCFGHVSHNLIDTSYEYDFGLVATLNAIDPYKLKSTDALEPSGAKRRRVQLPKDSDLTFFDFDGNSSILKSLTGKVRQEHAALFKHVTGANNVKVRSGVQTNQLETLCRKLFTLYSANTYKNDQRFAGIQNISPVKDPAVISTLDDKLVEAIIDKSDGVELGIPEIVDYGRDSLWATFYGAKAGAVYDDVAIEYYYDHLHQKGIDLKALTIDHLKNHGIALTDENGMSPGNSYPLYKCLIFDVTVGGETYHLCEGNWYKIDEGFIRSLTTYLDPFWASNTLPDYNGGREEKYTADVAAGDPSHILLFDQTSIAPSGQKSVEPCDLFEVANGKGVLHHIKRKTISSALSHLINQGANSITLIRGENAAKDKLLRLVMEKAATADQQPFIDAINTDSLEVSLGIICDKDPARKSLNLPLFSRISLMRIIKNLTLMRVKISYSYIPDTTTSSAGKKRKRKPKAPKNP